MAYLPWCLTQCFFQNISIPLSEIQDIRGLDHKLNHSKEALDCQVWGYYFRCILLSWIRDGCGSDLDDGPRWPCHAGLVVVSDPRFFPIVQRNREGVYHLLRDRSPTIGCWQGLFGLIIFAYLIFWTKHSLPTVSERSETSLCRLFRPATTPQLYKSRRSLCFHFFASLPSLLLFIPSPTSSRDFLLSIFLVSIGTEKLKSGFLHSWVLRQSSAYLNIRLLCYTHSPFPSVVGFVGSWQQLLNQVES